eukprot:jgi/Botrbrau1/20584/Bobra.113_1s0010.1
MPLRANPRLLFGHPPKFWKPCIKPTIIMRSLHCVLDPKVPLITRNMTPRENRYLSPDFRREPSPFESAVLDAPTNLIRSNGGYVLPFYIYLPRDDWYSAYGERGSNGVHVIVVFFGFTPLLQQLCDKLREMTIPEICVMVVGNSADAEAASNALKKLRFWPNAGSLVFRVRYQGMWPTESRPKTQKEEWQRFANYKNGYRMLPFPGSEYKRGLLPLRRGYEITYWRGYTSKSVVESEWGEFMKLEEGVGEGGLKLVDTQADVDVALEEEVRSFKAWALEGYKEALDEREACLLDGWMDASWNGHVATRLNPSWRRVNSNLFLKVWCQEKPVNDPSLWWCTASRVEMTPEILAEINRQMPWGKPV